MIEDLLRAESLAARIGAACQAEPALGRLWRAESVVAEAVASVGLEGVRIDAHDLLPRVAMNGGLTFDPDYVETLDVERALRAMRLLKRPGDPLRDPVGAVRRLERLGVASELETVLERSSDEERVPREPVLTDQEIEALMRCVGPSDPPILGALRVAAAYREAVPGAEPMVERGLFVAVEGALRQEAMLPGGQGRGGQQDSPTELEEEVSLRGLGESVDAHWIVLPSVALTRGALRLWDPSTTRGVRQILEGLVVSLRYDLGRLIPLRDWLELVARVGEGRTGRSRLMDAARLFAEQPVMTARDLADGLAITPRGAINLAATLADLGLLGEITHRRFARIWATPELARLLEPRAVSARMRRLHNPSRLLVRSGPEILPDAPPTGKQDPSRVARDWADRKAKSEARLERIFEELDGALARTDMLLIRR